MQTKPSGKLIFTLTLLVVGNLLGAGILAIPVDTGLAGFRPSMVVMAIVAGGMLFTAYALSVEANQNQDDTFNYPSLYQKYLGSSGKWVAIVANLIILWGVLAAYLAASTSILANVFELSDSSQHIITVVIFLILSVIVLSNITLIAKYNTLFMIILWVAFFIMILKGSHYIRVKNLEYTDIYYLAMATPIIAAAFFYHNIIPTLCREMKWSSDVWKPLFYGTIIGFLMNLIWMFVGIGAMPLSGDLSIYDAYVYNQPITINMSKMMHSSLFTTVSTLFALLSIFLAYLALGISLIDFSKDLLKNSFKIDSKIAIISFSFLPPITVALIDPNIFIVAMSFVGGVGIVLIAGVLPSLIALKIFKKRYLKVTALLTLTFFTIILSIKVLQLTKLIDIEPDIRKSHKSI